jgi:hypothetical protein
MTGGANPEESTNFNLFALLRLFANTVHWKVRFAYLKGTRLKLKVGDAWINFTFRFTAVYLYYYGVLKVMPSLVSVYPWHTLAPEFRV